MKFIRKAGLNLAVIVGLSSLPRDVPAIIEDLGGAWGAIVVYSVGCPYIRNNCYTDSIHTVQKGDNLTKISIQYYGKNRDGQVYYPLEIAQKNGRKLTDSLYPGERLIIP